MYRIGDLLMAGDILFINQLLGIEVGAALGIGANTAGHYKSYTTFGSLAKVGRHAFMAIGHFFKASVH
jgi:hypothetical protein